MYSKDWKKDDPTESCSLANACIGASNNHRLAVQSDLGVAPRTLCEQDPSRRKDHQTWLSCIQI
jgi:hypothetical protein